MLFLFIILACNVGLHCSQSSSQGSASKMLTLKKMHARNFKKTPNQETAADFVTGSLNDIFLKNPTEQSLARTVLIWDEIYNDNRNSAESILSNYIKKIAETVPDYPTQQNLATLLREISDAAKKNGKAQTALQDTEFANFIVKRLSNWLTENEAEHIFSRWKVIFGTQTVPDNFLNLMANETLSLLIKPNSTALPNVSLSKEVKNSKKIACKFILNNLLNDLNAEPTPHNINKTLYSCRSKYSGFDKYFAQVLLFHINHAENLGNTSALNELLLLYKKQLGIQKANQNSGINTSNSLENSLHQDLSESIEEKKKYISGLVAVRKQSYDIASTPDKVLAQMTREAFESGISINHNIALELKETLKSNLERSIEIESLMECDTATNQQQKKLEKIDTLSNNTKTFAIRFAQKNNYIHAFDFLFEGLLLWAAKKARDVDDFAELKTNWLKIFKEQGDLVKLSNLRTLLNPEDWLTSDSEQSTDASSTSSANEDDTCNDFSTRIVKDEKPQATALNSNSNFNTTEIKDKLPNDLPAGEKQPSKKLSIEEMIQQRVEALKKQNQN